MDGGSSRSTGTARDRRNERSHRAILRATWELMQESGYPALNIEAVAARAGVGKATIYRWWPSKGTLAVEAMRAHLNLTEIPDSGDARQDVRAAVRYVTDTLLHSAAGRIIPALANDLLSDPEAADMYREFVRGRRASALAALRRAADQGVLPADADLDLLVDLYAGTIYYRVIVSGLTVDDHVVDELTTLVLDGHCPRAAPPKSRRPARKTAAATRTAASTATGTAKAVTTKRTTTIPARSAPKPAKTAAGSRQTTRKRAAASAKKAAQPTTTTKATSKATQKTTAKTTTKTTGSRASRPA